MRVFMEYILGLMSQYGYPFAKFGSFFSSIASTIRWFFVWRTEKLKRKNSYQFYQDTSSEKQSYKLIGLGIGAFCFLVLTGFWVYSDYLNNKTTPEDLVKSYYNNIKIGNYNKAIDLISPELKKEKEQDINQLKTSWEKYSQIKICNVSVGVQTEARAYVTCELLVVSKIGGKKKYLKATSIVSRASETGNWAIHYFDAPTEIQALGQCGNNVN